jgi:hypothetical protein
VIRRLILAGLLLGALPATAAAPTRGYTVTGFDRIRVDGPFDVSVRTGMAPSARATGATTALDRIKIEVQNSTLVIKPDNTAWGGYPGGSIGKVSVALTMSDLSSATLAGSGKLTIDRVRGPALELGLGGAGTISIGQLAVDKLNLMITGSGNATLAGHVDDGTFVLRGAGNLAAAGLTVRDAKVVSAGAGTITLTASDTAKVTAAGTGDVTVLGKAECTVDATGAGTVACGKPSASSFR